MQRFTSYVQALTRSAQEFLRDARPDIVWGAKLGVVLCCIVVPLIVLISTISHGRRQDTGSIINNANTNAKVPEQKPVPRVVLTNAVHHEVHANDKLIPGDCMELFFSEQPVGEKREVNKRSRESSVVPIWHWYVKRAPCELPGTGQTRGKLGTFLANPALFPLAFTDPYFLSGDRTEQEQNALILTSLAGLRDNPTTARRDRSYHNGVDLRAAIGEPVYAQYRAKVTEMDTKRGDSNCGKRLTLDFENLGMVYVTYCHLSAYPLGLKVGDMVQREQVVAFSGASGNATRYGKKYPHLHMQLKVDKEKFETYIRSMKNEKERARLRAMLAEFLKAKIDKNSSRDTFDPLQLRWVFVYRQHKPKPPTTKDWLEYKQQQIRAYFASK